MAYAVINKKTSPLHAAQLSELASTAGLQRTRASTVLNSIGDGYAFTVAYGKGTANVSGRGNPYVGTVDAHAETVDSKAKQTDAAQSVAHEDPAGMLVGMATKFNDIIVPGSAPMNKAVGTLHVPCGICVIVAKGGAGKTPLAHHLAGAGVDEYATIRVGEPFAGYSTNRQTVARDLGRAMVSHSDIVLDSIKDLLAEGGGLMKGGIARAALVDLSAWATQAAALGVTIYIPLNPSGDEELVRIMTEVARSNATMTVSHNGGSSWAYSTRTGEGMERVSGSYEFRRTGETLSRSEKELLVKFDASEVKRDTFAGILQRSRSI